MGAITYEGKRYEPSALKPIYFEDIVSLNGYVGHIDYIGEEEVCLLTEDNKPQRIKYSDIKEAYMLHMGWSDPHGGRMQLDNILNCA